MKRLSFLLYFMVLTPSLSRAVVDCEIEISSCTNEEFVNNAYCNNNVTSILDSAPVWNGLTYTWPNQHMSTAGTTYWRHYPGDECYVVRYKRENGVWQGIGSAAIGPNTFFSSGDFFSGYPTSLPSSCPGNCDAQWTALVVQCGNEQNILWDSATCTGSCRVDTSKNLGTCAE